MKFLNSISNESKIYIYGIIFSILGVLVISSVIFMFLIANRLDTVVSQNTKITYTYFIFIMNRILLLITTFFIIPLSVYQYKFRRTKADKITGLFSILLILISICTIFLGEYNFFHTYKNGELQNSPMFSKPTLETKIFDRILAK